MTPNLRDTPLKFLVAGVATPSNPPPPPPRSAPADIYPLHSPSARFEHLYNTWLTVRITEAFVITAKTLRL